jgi:hypothetical protein
VEKLKESNVPNLNIKTGGGGVAFSWKLTPNFYTIFLPKNECLVER